MATVPGEEEQEQVRQGRARAQEPKDGEGPLRGDQSRVQRQTAGEI